MQRYQIVTPNIWGVVVWAPTFWTHFFHIHIVHRDFFSFSPFFSWDSFCDWLFCLWIFIRRGLVWFRFCDRLFCYSTLSFKLGPFCREYDRAYRVIMLGPFCRPHIASTPLSFLESCMGGSPNLVLALSEARLKSTSLGMPVNWRRVCNLHVWPASEVTREVRLTRKQKSSPCQAGWGRGNSHLHKYKKKHTISVFKEHFKNT